MQAEKGSGPQVGMLAQTAIGTALETAAVGKIMGPDLAYSLQQGGVSNKALKEAIEETERVHCVKRGNPHWQQERKV